jgi:predicted AlkP superfamily pyrophosphatase or phosphodiesterase|tara:strand:+ start:1360 stop:1545 length:186 start_codon:yes stop_codon:yes gene_type:complete
MFEVCISLKPHTPFLVKITSQTMKKVAVINIDGNRYLNLDAYLNLLSHDANKGKEIVKRSN